MQKIKYEFKSIEFLNATIDEIYYRKKHYVTGKELLMLKGMLSSYFVQLERTFRYVYFSDISVDTKKIDLSLFERQFPFIFETFYNKTYEIHPDNAEDCFVDGVTYYTWLLEQLRNINLHAVVSTAVAKIFQVDENFISQIPRFSDKVTYSKNGVLTIAGMFGLLLPTLHAKYAKFLLGYIFQQWSEPLFGLTFHDSRFVSENLWAHLSSVYKTNYETEIRVEDSSNDVIKSIFGRELSSVKFEASINGQGFLLDLSQQTKSPRFQASGYISENGLGIILTVEKGSNIGVYFSEQFELHIRNRELFSKFAALVPPFMAISYLYHHQITVFDDITYQELDLFFFKKLNNPKFYVDKSIPILCYGNKNADIREINKSVSENLLRLFLDFEEAVIFRNDIPVYGTYSKFMDIMKVFNIPYMLASKLIACRNFCSHEGMLDNFHYCTPDFGYKITLDFICESIDEFINHLEKIGEQEHAHWLQKDLEHYILNNLIGVKYKRIFEMSIRLFRSYGDWIPTNCANIKKSLGAVYNSCISTFAENILAGKMKRKFSFYIAPTLWEMQENTFEFSELILYKIHGKNLEIKGSPSNVEMLEFFQTPATNLSKLTQNGKPVKLELVEEKREGVLIVRTYTTKS